MTLKRNSLGSLNFNGAATQLYISAIDVDMGWSELKAYVETKKAALACFLIDLKFGLLD